MKVFLNFTNHPTSKWNDQQIAEAKKFGEIVDVSFPVIPPEASDFEVSHIINKTLGEALFYYDELGESNVQRRHITLHVMGEMSGFFHAVMFAFGSDCFDRVVISTTDRKVVEKNGVKTSVFKFIQFRELNNPIPEIRKDAVKSAITAGSTAEFFD